MGHREGSEVLNFVIIFMVSYTGYTTILRNTAPVRIYFFFFLKKGLKIKTKFPFCISAHAQARTTNNQFAGTCTKSSIQTLVKSQSIGLKKMTSWSHLWMRENTDLAPASIRAEVVAFSKDQNGIFGTEGELLKS